jgi:hypothetical protein
MATVHKTTGLIVLTIKFLPQLRPLRYMRQCGTGALNRCLNQSEMKSRWVAKSAEQTKKRLKQALAEKTGGTM